MDRQIVSSQDRLMAGLIDLSAIPFPYIGPLVGLAIAHQSPYARFHAIRVILDELAMTAVSIVLILISLSWTVVSLMRTGLDLSHIDWKFMLLKAAAFWLILQALALMNTITAIFTALQAFQGKYPKRMRGLKKLAAKMSGIPAIG